MGTPETSRPPEPDGLTGNIQPGRNRLGEKNGKGYNIKVKVGRKLDRDVKYNPLLYRKK